MKRMPLPFRAGRRIEFEGKTSVITHVDLGMNRIELENVETHVRKDEDLTPLFVALSKQLLRVFDKDGTPLDFSHFHQDVLALSPKKQKQYEIRVDVVTRLDPLGRCSPSSQEFIDAVSEASKAVGVEVAPSTAYSWLQIYRKEGVLSALALPRKGTKANAPKPRMAALTSQAMEEVLNEESEALREMLKEQKREHPTSGRNHRSIRMLTIKVKARVERLHQENHARINERRRTEGLRPLPLLPCPLGPSNRTLQRKVYGRFSRWRLLEAMYGSNVAKRKLGPFGPSFKLTRICERWEPDVFIADIIVAVFYQGILVPVGIPYLTMMVDCFSSAIVGAIIEFKPPTYRSFLALMKQSVLPKDWLFERFPTLTNKFQAFGVPEVIGFDNAGMFSKMSIPEAQAALGIILEPAKAYTPNDKPFVESAGATLGRTFMRFQPANKKSIADARDLEYKALLQPPMPIETFVQKFWEWVCNLYHQSPMEDKHQWSRAQSWVYSAQQLAFSDDPAELFPLDRREIDTSIAARHELQYTHEGFAINNRHFRSTEMHAIAMRLPEKHLFDVREDAWDPHKVYIVLNEMDSVITVPVASEVPDFLTAEAFDDVQAAKAAMANIDYQALAAAMDSVMKGSRPPRGTTHFPTSRDGLTVLIARNKELVDKFMKASARTPASLSGNAQADSNIRDALNSFFASKGETDG